MSENPFKGISQETADEIAKEAYEKKDYLTLTELSVADEPEQGDIGLPVKTTPGAKDIR